MALASYNRAVRIALLACIASLLLGMSAATAAEEPDAVATESCIACRAKVESIRSTLSNTEWEEVQRGEIITSKVDTNDAQGNKQSLVQSAAIVRFTPAEVWSVVIDFESRNKFVPGNQEAKIVRREGNQWWIREHLRVLLMNIRFGVINTIEPEIGRVTWRIDPEAENDITDTTGSWQIAGLEAERTLVHYLARVDSGQPVPGFIENYFAERSLPKMIGGLREELGRRFPRLRDADRPPDIKALDE